MYPPSLSPRVLNPPILVVLSSVCSLQPSEKGVVQQVPRGTESNTAELQRSQSESELPVCFGASALLFSHGSGIPSLPRPGHGPTLCVIGSPRALVGLLEI